MPVLLLCTVLLFSCERPFVLGPSQEPARTVQLEQADEEVMQIAEDARDTLTGFFRRINSAGAEESDFCVKYPFAVNDDSGIDTEQIWLTGIRFRDGTYYGILAGTPRCLDGMKRGDTVAFDTEMITDWMYVRNGKIIGGYSIKYLLEKIPDDQRTDSERKLLQMFD